MNIGPDGSLCRITSSSKDYVNNIQIVKVSEDELLKSNGPPYKLVLIGREDNDCESLSEKSDEDVLEAEKINLNELKADNVEKDKVIKVKEADKLKHNSKKFTENRFDKRYKSNRMQRNRKNYKSFKTRNFNATGNVNKSYKRQMTNTSSNDIQPWLDPTNIPQSTLIAPPNIPQSTLRAYAVYSHFSPLREPLLKPSVNSNVDKCVGLLGDYPSGFSQHDIQSRNQIKSFGHNQNIWDNRYYHNYQGSVQDMPNSIEHGHKTFSQNKHWKDKGRKVSWRRNQERRENIGHYDYRK